MLKTRTSNRPDRPLDGLEKGRDVGLLARVEPESVRLAPFRADALGELFQSLRVARAPGDADREPFGGERPGDRRPEAVARPDHHADAAPRLAHS